MIHEINKHLAERAKLKKELKEWVKNKDIPLETRWDIFIMSELGDHKIYIERFNCNIGNDYIENLESRYTTEYVESILDWVEEQVTDDETPVYTEEDIIKFKENVLEKFIYSFEFDW
jgi:hypothetical protein